MSYTWLATLMVIYKLARKYKREVKQKQNQLCYTWYKRFIRIVKINIITISTRNFNLNCYDNIWIELNDLGIENFCLISKKFRLVQKLSDTYPLTWNTYFLPLKCLKWCCLSIKSLESFIFLIPKTWSTHSCLCELNGLGHTQIERHLRIVPL